METTISDGSVTENMKPTKFVPIDQIDWNCLDPHPYDLIDWDNEDALPKKQDPETGEWYIDIPIVPMTEEEFEKIDWARMSAYALSQDVEDSEKPWFIEDGKEND